MNDIAPMDWVLKKIALLEIVLPHRVGQIGEEL